MPGDGIRSRVVVGDAGELLLQRRGVGVGVPIDLLVHEVHGRIPARRAGQIAFPAVSGTEGLTEAEAQRRLAERGPLPAPSTSRSYRSIVVANTFTVFNAILLFFGLLTILFGDPKDALFVGILIANMTIGIAQEVRAKRALDALAALVAPKATVVRGGTARDVAVERRRRRRSGARAGGRPGGRRRRSGARRGPGAGRVQPHRRVRAGARPAGAHGVQRLLRRRGRGRVRGDRGRARLARRAADRDRARLPPSALAAGAGDGPAADHLRGGDAAAGDRAGRVAGHPRRLPGPGGGDAHRRRREHRARGPDPARLADHGGVGGEDGAPRDPGPAAQRDRVAGLGQRPVHRQDRHADRGGAARGGRGARRRPRRARGGARPGALRGQRADAQLDAGGGPRGGAGR